MCSSDLHSRRGSSHAIVAASLRRGDRHTGQTRNLRLNPRALRKQCGRFDTDRFRQGPEPGAQQALARALEPLQFAHPLAEVRCGGFHGGKGDVATGFGQRQMKLACAAPEYLHVGEVELMCRLPLQRLVAKRPVLHRAGELREVPETRVLTQVYWRRIERMRLTPFSNDAGSRACASTLSAWKPWTGSMTAGRNNPCGSARPASTAADL